MPGQLKLFFSYWLKYICIIKNMSLNLINQTKFIHYEKAT